MARDQAVSIKPCACLQMSVFASEMDRLKVTEKVLVRDGKRLIRQDLKAIQLAASDLLEEPESTEVAHVRSPVLPIVAGHRQAAESH